MRAATQSVHIDLAPDTLFDRLVDPTLLPPGMSMQTLHESTAGVGNVYEWTYRFAGMPFRGITVYTEYVPNQRFGCMNKGMVGATAAFALEPDDGGTRLTRQIDFEVRIPMVGTLLEALMVKAAKPNAVRTAVCPTLVDFFLRRGVEDATDEDGPRMRCNGLRRDPRSAAGARGHHRSPPLL